MAGDALLMMAQDEAAAASQSVTCFHDVTAPEAQWERVAKIR